MSTRILSSSKPYSRTMLLSPEHKMLIRKQFRQMQSRGEFLALLNYTKNILYEKGVDRPIKMNSLSWYTDYRLSGSRRYTSFTIPKKSGGERTIFAPAGALKTIQRCLNIILQVVFEPNNVAHGFVPGRSIVTNALAHVGKLYVYNLDLKDFFPSIELRRIKKCLELPPYNLTVNLPTPTQKGNSSTDVDSTDLSGFLSGIQQKYFSEQKYKSTPQNREQLAYLIANLCCTVDENGRAFLPQGAPTSPIITNIVCQKLDRRLNGLAKRFGAKYTRYADDITFSSDINLYQPQSEFLTELHRIIIDQGFTIQERKTRLQKRQGYRQEVTGLTVNERVNVSKHYLRNLRALLNNWEKYGYDEAEARFHALASTKARVGLPALRNVLFGKIEFLKMVRGNEDLLYKKYANQYKALIDSLPQQEASVSFEELLDVWESEGIGSAMRIYEQRKLVE